MKIGLYNPYFDSLGGGERYVLTLAEHWSKTHDVSIFWDDESVISQAQKRFDVDLTFVHVVPNIFHSHNLIRKLFITRGYDCIFFLSDGSIPMSLAKRNILHFQVPFSHIIIPFWKSTMYQRVVCNSEFTKTYLDSTVSIRRSVIYPPVDIGKLTPGKKSNTILTVGRFSSLYGAKKQDVLIDSFKKAFENKEFTDWNFVIAGGLLESDQDYFNELKKKVSGLPIDFYPNCSWTDLQAFYSIASIYWHAAGFGESKPEYMEHFGITTVEAMAAGCIPVVYNGGGQPEIVEDAQTGFLWKTPDELIKKTLSVMDDKKEYSRIADSAMKRAKEFSKEKFTRSFDLLLSEL